MIKIKEEKKISKEELLKKAARPGKDAMKLHPFYHGKIEVLPKCCIRDFQDFGIWYTPGVAEPCKAIKADKEKVFEYTNKWNTVAVVSDGTRVLGLGDIGPEAGLPVMEGKALLFKYLGGVDAVPLCLDTKDPEELINTVKLLKPSFGGINLEDIASPKCFYILDRLREEMDIPVWHDDQQGTAAITLAGLINALKIVGKKKEDVKIAMIGSGAANISNLRVMVYYGFPPENVIMTDIYGMVSRERPNFEKQFPYAPIRELLIKTNSENKKCDDPEEAKRIAMEDVDAAICFSKTGPGTVKPKWVKRMAEGPIIFACANPVPEIWPWEAKEAGARIVATGRSDFPNQTNNSLGFPGIFRGTLDVRAKTITDEMCIAAAYELAKTADDKGLQEDYIVPTMDEWEVFPREAVAVGMKAIEQGIARKKLSRQELLERAEAIIKEARDKTKFLMKEGFIKKPSV